MWCMPNSMSGMNQFLSSQGVNCGCGIVGGQTESCGCQRPSRPEPRTNVIAGESTSAGSCNCGCRSCGCGNSCNCSGVITNHLLREILEQLEAIYTLLDERLPEV